MHPACERPRRRTNDSVAAVGPSAGFLLRISRSQTGPWVRTSVRTGAVQPSIERPSERVAGRHAIRTGSEFSIYWLRNGRYRLRLLKRYRVEHGQKSHKCTVGCESAELSLPRAAALHPLGHPRVHASAAAICFRFCASHHYSGVCGGRKNWARLPRAFLRLLGNGEPPRWSRPIRSRGDSHPRSLRLDKKPRTRPRRPRCMTCSDCHFVGGEATQIGNCSQSGSPFTPLCRAFG